MTTMREYAATRSYAAVTGMVEQYPTESLEPGDRISATYLRPTDRHDRATIYLVERACDRDVYGRDIMSESNFATLQEWYPDTFVVVSYLNTDQLAILADQELPDGLEETLDGLADYPIVDESDWSERDWQYREGCWDEYGRDDFRRAVENEAGDKANLLDLSDERLDALMADAEEHGRVIAEGDGSGYWWEGHTEEARRFVEQSGI